MSKSVVGVPPDYDEADRRRPEPEGMREKVWHEASREIQKIDMILAARNARKKTEGDEAPTPSEVTEDDL